MKRFIVLAAAAVLALGNTLHAAVPVEVVHGTSYIAPAYFGPYAYPVPDCSDAKLHSRLYVEASFDGVVGHAVQQKDYTLCPSFKLVVPLWTDRANLLIFGDVHEFFKDNAEVRAYRRVAPAEPLQEESSGNIYYGIEMLVLTEGQYRPSVVLAAYTQSATGDKYEMARHYDCPGYHFTLSAGKSLGAWRVSAYGGFLCWQTDRGRQNDAVMLGAKLSYDSKWISASAEYGQYTGWEKQGDRPQVLKLRTDFHIGHVSPFVNWQHGFRDWPFDLLRVGAAYSF